jgi:hypothetical protein
VEDTSKFFEAIFPRLGSSESVTFAADWVLHNSYEESGCVEARFGGEVWKDAAN